MRRVPLCMLEAMEGELYFLGGAGGTGDAVEGKICLLGGAGDAAGDAPCAVLYAGDCGR